MMKLRLTLVCCLVGFVLVTISATAQVTEKPPLQYRISLKQLDREKKSMTVKLRLINAGSKSIVIDKNSLGYSVSFVRLGKKLPNGGVTSGEGRVVTGDPGPSYQGDYLVLAPKQFFESERVFAIDPPFFVETRHFTISLSYGQFMRIRFKGLLVWRGVVNSNRLGF